MTMHGPPEWIARICRRVRPNIGGLLTVCQDDDHLLDDALVRSTLSVGGVTVSAWDGQATTVPLPAAVGPADRPVLVVPASAPRHILYGLWPTGRADLTLHASDIWPRLDREIVLAVPAERRESLLAVALATSTPLSRRESALLVARSLYGVDTSRLALDGWWSTVLLLWLQGIVLPPVVAEEVVQAVSRHLPLTAADAVVALTADESRPTWLATALKGGPPGLIVRGEAAEPLARLMKRATIESPQPAEVDLVDSWEAAKESPAALAEVARVWAAGVAAGTLTQVNDTRFQTAFESWLRARSPELLHTPTRDLMPIHAVVAQLDNEVGDRPFLLVVLDAMGLVPWYSLLAAWRNAGARWQVDTRVAVAAAPTITAVSRLSLMAGELQPAGFTASDRAEAERRAWAERFRERDSGGRCCVIAVKDAWRQTVSDRLAQGVPRLALIDVSWDHRTHHADPGEGTISHHATRWAGTAAATAVRGVIQEALEAEYRVFVTADHGFTEATGTGRTYAGDLVEEGSKRVLLFKTAASALAYQNSGFVWQPETSPTHLHALFARAGESFDQRGARSFCHGGLSPGEVLVPVAELRAERG